MKKSFEEFRLAKKVKKCKVCALPDAVKKQLEGRSRHTSTLTTVLEWISTEWGIKITKPEYMVHCRGAHPWHGRRKK